MATTVHTYRTLNDYRIFSEPMPESSNGGSKLFVGAGILAVALIIGGGEYYMQHRAAQLSVPATETTEQVAPTLNESTPASDAALGDTPNAANSINDQQALTSNEQMLNAPQVAPPSAQPTTKKADSTSMKRQTPAASSGETRAKPKASVSTPAAASAPAAAASEAAPESSTQPAAVESQPAQQPADTSATEPTMPQSMESQSAAPDQTAPTTVQ